MNTVCGNAYATIPKPGTQITNTRPVEVSGRVAYRHIHGDARSTEFDHLADPDNLRSISFFGAERDRFNKTFYSRSPTSKLREEIEQELLATQAKWEQSEPEVYDKWQVKSRRHRDWAHREYRVRQKGKSGKYRKLVDLNDWAKDKEYFQILTEQVTPDGKYLLIAYDETGGEFYTVELVELATGKRINLSEQIGKVYDIGVLKNYPGQFYFVKAGPEWVPNEAYISDYRDPRKVNERATRIAQTPTNDDSLSVKPSSNGEYLIIDISKNYKNQSYVYKLDGKKTTAERVPMPKHGVSVLVDHIEDSMFRIVEDQAGNNQLYRNGKMLLESKPASPIEDFSVVDGGILIRTRQDGFPVVKLLVESESGNLQYVDVYSSERPVAITLEGSSFTVETLTHPGKTYSVEVTDPKQGDFVLKKIDEKKIEGKDLSQYHTETVTVQSHDGTEVPVMVAYKGKLNKPRPMFLKGYGAYALSWDADFDADLLPLMDRGYVVAIAKVRGGRDFGRPWHEAGSGMNKLNTFNDFTSAAEGLIEKGYANPKRVAVQGSSAGGTLIGNVIQQRPELFNVAVARVPFVRVIDTMLMDHPLISMDYQEWGNPRIREQYFYMKAYSPTDGVAGNRQTALFVTGGISDNRVNLVEPAELVARMREVEGSDAPPLVFKVVEGGHFGPSGATGRAIRNAEIFAWVLHQNRARRKPSSD